MAAPADRLEIVQGQLGQLEGKNVGVVWTAEDGSSARVMVAGTSGGTPWEILSDVHPRDVLPLGGPLVQVTGIAAPHDGARGAVAFAPRDGAAGVAAPPDVVMLPAGGRLRLDGPSVMTATDMTVLAWQPDERRPEAVTVEWLPARFAREDTPPADITRMDLRVGSTAAVGRSRVTVAAIQGASDRHPAWLVLRVAQQAADK